MGRAGHIHVVRLALGVLVCCVALTPAALADPPGGPCAQHDASAVNQYCENVPSASGPGTPAPGMPALAPTLPPRVLRGLSRTAPGPLPLRTRQRLRMLPAPARPTSVPVGSVAPTSSADVMSQWLTFILVLVAIGLALVLVAFERWRRQRRSHASPPPG